MLSNAATLSESKSDDVNKSSNDRGVASLRPAMMMASQSSSQQQPLSAQSSPAIPSSQSLTAHYIPERLPWSPSQGHRATRRQHGKGAFASTPRDSPIPNLRSGESSSNRIHLSAFASSSSPPPGYNGSSGRGSPALHQVSGTSANVAAAAREGDEDKGQNAQSGALFSGPSNDEVVGREIPGLAKRGAGRDAWGPDGAGNRGLGAGGFEDDDGIDLDALLPNSKGNNLQDEMGLDARGENETIYSSTQLGDKNNSEAYLSNESQNQLRRLIDGPSERDSRPMSRGGEKSKQSKLGNRLRRIFGGKPVNSAPAAVVSGREEPRLRWNRFKWLLAASNSFLTLYSLGGLVGTLLTWASYFEHADVITLVNRTELILGTAAMILCLATSIVGWAGIFLNNRAFLTVYATLLWPAFALVVAPGYITYKKRAFNLDGKINNLWSRLLTIDERRQIQLAFSCCGYYSPYVEASADSFRCFARSLLPGCKGPFMKFQSEALMIFYAASFAIVPVHLFCIIVALLCSDHVTYRFGKGITPKAYRLDEDAIADMKSAIIAHVSTYNTDHLHPTTSAARQRRPGRTSPSSSAGKERELSSKEQIVNGAGTESPYEEIPLVPMQQQGMTQSYTPQSSSMQQPFTPAAADEDTSLINQLNAPRPPFWSK